MARKKVTEYRPDQGGEEPGEPEGDPQAGHREADYTPQPTDEED